MLPDRLGTNRMSGARFYPYGDEITSTSNDREKFATYTRDGYTGLDYADQRFYASTYGRFNTQDPSQSPAPSDPSSPASWNRFSYASLDPINNNDPTGLDDDCDPTLELSEGCPAFGPDPGPGSGPSPAPPPPPQITCPAILTTLSIDLRANQAGFG